MSWIIQINSQSKLIQTHVLFDNLVIKPVSLCKVNDLCHYTSVWPKLFVTSQCQVCWTWPSGHMWPSGHCITSFEILNHFGLDVTLPTGATGHRKYQRNVMVRNLSLSNVELRFLIFLFFTTWIKKIFIRIWGLFWWWIHLIYRESTFFRTQPAFEPFYI